MYLFFKAILSKMQYYYLNPLKVKPIGDNITFLINSNWSIFAIG